MKSDKERQITHSIIDMQNLKKKKFAKLYSREGLGVGEIGRGWLKGTTFSYKMNKV